MAGVTISGGAGSDQLGIEFPNGSRAEASAAALESMFKQTYDASQVHEESSNAHSGMLLLPNSDTIATNIEGYSVVAVGTGASTLTGASAAVTVVGGNDGMTFATQYDASVDLAGGANLITNAGTGRLSVTAGLGATTVLGGNGSVTAFVTGGSITGGSAGNNVIIGDGGAPTTIVGGGNGDFLEADSSGSVVRGGPGAETLVAGVSNVTLTGGTGDDFFIMRTSGTVYAGPGNDTIGATSLYASRANTFTPGGLTVYGDNTDPTSGTLTFYGGTLGSTVVGGNGAVIAYSAAGSDSVTGSTVGHNILIGGSGNDTLVGAGSNDYMAAGSGNASLVSGGADVQFLVNGVGADTMVGSTNSSAVDVFEFLTNGMGQNYLVNNFHVGDLVYLNSQQDVNYALAHQNIVTTGGVTSDVVSLGGSATGNNATITLTNVSAPLTNPDFGHK